jgi:hypothetical protein
MDLVSVFCKKLSSFPSNICWRGCLFSIICFWHLCQKLDQQSCMASYPGPLFCSTGLHICYCARNKLFLLLWICSIVLTQLMWYLQGCSFCSVLPWLFLVFYVSKWTLGLIFSLCDECHWDFDGNCIEHVVLAIFTMLILSIQEHGKSFHFL